MQDFSLVVRKALKIHRKNVSQLANDLEKSTSYLYDLLKGNRRWNESLMKQTGEVLGITIEYKIS